jgi:hypothetical protein
MGLESARMGLESARMGLESARAGLGSARFQRAVSGILPDTRAHDDRAHPDAGDS